MIAPSDDIGRTSSGRTDVPRRGDDGPSAIASIGREEMPAPRADGAYAWQGQPRIEHRFDHGMELKPCGQVGARSFRQGRSALGPDELDVQDTLWEVSDWVVRQ